MRFKLGDEFFDTLFDDVCKFSVSNWFDYRVKSSLLVKKKSRMAFSVRSLRYKNLES